MKLERNGVVEEPDGQVLFGSGNTLHCWACAFLVDQDSSLLPLLRLRMATTYDTTTKLLKPTYPNMLLISATVFLAGGRADSKQAHRE